jgi:hypothetical protein
MPVKTFKKFEMNRVETNHLNTCMKFFRRNENYLGERRKGPASVETSRSASKKKIVIMTMDLRTFTLTFPVSSYW